MRGAGDGGGARARRIGRRRRARRSRQPGGAARCLEARRRAPACGSRGSKRGARRGCRHVRRGAPAGLPDSAMLANRWEPQNTGWLQWGARHGRCEAHRMRAHTPIFEALSGLRLPRLGWRGGGPSLRWVSWALPVGAQTEGAGIGRLGAPEACARVRADGGLERY